jgi:RNA polymerase-binding transcription factor DksA
VEEQDTRRRLESELRRLSELEASITERTLADSEREAFSELSTVDQHPADEATETLEREQDLSMAEGTRGEIAAVEAALKRLAEGVYGRCEVCGKKIDDARLETLPAAALCVEHQTERDRRARTV